MSLRDIPRNLSAMFNNRAVRTAAKAAVVGIETLALLTEIGAVTAVAPAALLAVAGAAVLVGAVVAGSENEAAVQPALAEVNNANRLAAFIPGKGLKARSSRYIR